MKILHVIAGLAKTGGGTSEVVPRMCEALKDLGHDVCILTVDWGPVSDAVNRARLKGVRVDQYNHVACPVLNGLGVSKEFSVRVVDAVKWADVVHLHGLWQWPCWRAAKEARKSAKSYVVQTHGFLEPERLKKSSLRKKVIGCLIEHPLINKAARIIATAESEKVGIEAWGVKPSIGIVPIGMDTAMIDAAMKDRNLIARLTDGPIYEKKILLYFSRFAPIKGLDMLAKAWAQLKDFHREWHLLLVGPNDRGYAEEMKVLYNRICPRGTWTIHGPVFGTDKFTLLKSADVFILPTRSENFSIAVQESLAAGVPVVCTKGAPWNGLNGSDALYGDDVVAPNQSWGRCGHWVDASVDGIRGGLETLLGMDDASRRNMGAEGRKFIRSEFNWTNIAERLSGIYQEILR